MLVHESTARYRTIVADPPWQIGEFPEWGDGKGTIATPYPTMALEDIKALPVASFAAPEAHLYLWTTVEFLRAAYVVAEAWGFEPMYPLHWCKPPRGIGMGGKFASNVEYVLFCRERHGAVRITSYLATPPALRCALALLLVVAVVLDLVEQMSPRSLLGDVRPPELLPLLPRRADAAQQAGVTTKDVNRAMGTSDMAGWWLSRLPHRSRIRNRLGWDTWGNESFEHVEMAA